jgi:hypothetical protein
MHPSGFPAPAAAPDVIARFEIGDRRTHREDSGELIADFVRSIEAGPAAVGTIARVDRVDSGRSDGDADVVVCQWVAWERRELDLAR